MAQQRRQTETRTIDAPAPGTLDKVIAETAAQLDSRLDDYFGKRLNAIGKFARAHELASMVGALETAITPDFMRPIMDLRDKRIGFRTDRDPTQTDYKTGRAHVPYAEDVVKRCLIEAVICGVYPTGNEFNIIAGNCYITREGYTRLVREIEGLTDLQLSPAPPKRVGEDGAIVDFDASWKMNGVQQAMRESIPVKINKGMGTDAILGKAERKMLYRVYKRATGSETSLPEGDVDDAPFNPPAPKTKTLDPTPSASTANAGEVVTKEKLSDIMESIKLLGADGPAIGRRYGKPLDMLTPAEADDLYSKLQDELEREGSTDLFRDQP